MDKKISSSSRRKKKELISEILHIFVGLFFIFLILALISGVFNSSILDDKNSTITGKVTYENDIFGSFYEAKLSNIAYQKLTQEGNKEHRFIVSGADVYDSSRIQHITGDPIDRLSSGDIVMSADSGDIAELLNNLHVSKIYYDRPVTLLRDDAINTINLSYIRQSGSIENNKTGEGIKIAVIDSGVNHSHSEFNCIMPGGDCFIKKSLSLVDVDDTILLSRRITNRFSDGTTGKILPLNNRGNKAMNISLSIPMNSTLNDAVFSIHGMKQGFAGRELFESLELYLDDVEIDTFSLSDDYVLVNLTDEIPYCSQDICEYIITIVSNQTLFVGNLSLDYNLSLQGFSMYGYDELDHGTAITGIIKAVAPDVDVYSYKIFNNLGESSTSYLIEAIDLAIKEGVDIISLSLGVSREGGSCDYPPLEDIIQKAYSEGILIVSASGNDPSGNIMLPACLENVTAISSVSNEAEVSAFNSYGPEMDFTMPGESINSTNKDGGYGLFSGTSFAVPFASGTFALLIDMLESEYGLVPSQHNLIDFASSNSRDVHLMGYDNKTGNGILDAGILLSSLSDDPNLFIENDTIILDTNKPYATLSILSNNIDDIDLRINEMVKSGTSQPSIDRIPLLINNEPSISFLDLEDDTAHIYEGVYYASVYPDFDSIPDGAEAGDYVSSIEIMDKEIPINFEYDPEIVYLTATPTPVLEQDFSLNLSINDSMVFINESLLIDAIVSYTGDNNQTLPVNITFSKQGFSDNISMHEINLVNGSQVNLSSQEFILNQSGTNRVDAELVYDGDNESISKVSSLDIEVQDDMLSYSSEFSSNEIHVDDTFRLNIKVKNKNNEDETVSLSVSALSEGLSSSGLSSLSHVISSGKSYTFSPAFSVSKPGSHNISAVLDIEGSPISYSFMKEVNVNFGEIIWINITDSYEDHEVGINDTIKFIVDDDCEDNYESCNDTCDDAENSCTDECRAEKYKLRAQMSTCKDECGDYDGYDERIDCRDDCEDEFEYDESYEDCEDVCIDTLDDCQDDCEDVYDDCVDDSFLVEIDVLNQEEGEIDLYIDSDEPYEPLFDLDEEDKFDLDDDGYYETMMQLIELIEKEPTCEDRGEEILDDFEDTCDVDYDNCRAKCNAIDDNDDKSDCRADCRYNKEDCEYRAEDEHDFFMDDCEIYYSSYVLNLKKIEPEKITYNFSYNLSSDYDDNSSNDTINSGNQSEENQDNVSNDESENDSSIDDALCGPGDLSECVDKQSCGKAHGYWYDGICNKYPDTTDEEPTDPVNEDTINDSPSNDDNDNSAESENPNYNEDQTAPLEEKPSSSGGSLMRFILVVIVLLIIGALSTGGYFYMKNTAKSEEKHSKTSLKKEELKDYFMKQLEKGNNINYIALALKKLGWDPNMVDSVAQEIINDPNAKAIAQIVNFALTYGIKDSAFLKRKFPNYGDEIMAQALNDINKRSI